MTRRRSASGALVLVVLAACSPSGGDSAQEARVQEPSAAASASPSRSTPSLPAEPSASGSAAKAQRPPRGARPERATAGWGPGAAELRRAHRLAAGMPLEELAGQVIVAEYDGTQAPGALVNELHLGGVIVMDDNIAGTSALRESNRLLRDSAREAGRRWPVFIGVDQEGGIVERVQDRATRFPAFMSAGAADDTALTRGAAAASGGELVDLGFTAVFAPDGDVTSGPEDPTIGSRSAGSDPRLVARQMDAAVDGYLAAGILPVIKHFPGHGSVPADSHLELPVQTRSLRELHRKDLMPFKSGVEHGVPAVMVAHIDVRAVDAGTPSTLSRPVVTGLLRRQLGFEGLAVTDAMNMAGVADTHSSAEGAVGALAAGNDVVLMPPDPRAARDGIVAAVRRGVLARARLEQAAARQIAILLYQQAVRPDAARRPGSSGSASYRLSAGAATVVSGPCQGRLVGPAVSATGAPEAVARFHDAARRAGLGVGSGTSVALVGYGGSGASADVVVTTDTPYALGRSDARVARIAMYGDTPGAMRALVEVLLGRATAPGSLPVPVPDVARRGC